MDIEYRKAELKKINRQGLIRIAKQRIQQIESIGKLLESVDSSAARYHLKQKHEVVSPAESLRYLITGDDISIVRSDRLIESISQTEQLLDELNQALLNPKVPEADLRQDDRKRSPGIRLSDDDWEEIETICASQKIHIGAYFRELALKDLEGRRNP